MGWGGGGLGHLTVRLPAGRTPFGPLACAPRAKHCSSSLQRFSAALAHPGGHMAPSVSSRAAAVLLLAGCSRVPVRNAMTHVWLLCGRHAGGIGSARALTCLHARYTAAGCTSSGSSQAVKLTACRAHLAACRTQGRPLPMVRRVGAWVGAAAAKLRAAAARSSVLHANILHAARAPLGDCRWGCSWLLVSCSFDAAGCSKCGMHSR